MTTVDTREENLTFGTPVPQVGETLHCTQVLYLMRDVQGRSWVAVGEAEGQQPGGVMSHFTPGGPGTVTSTSSDKLMVAQPLTTLPDSVTDAGQSGGTGPGEEQLGNRFAAPLPAYWLPGALFATLLSGPAKTLT